MPQKEKTKKSPLWLVIALDLLALGACLVVFALFHHVIPRSMDTDAPRPVSATPAPRPAWPS